jgi:hypothetical protein
MVAPTWTTPGCVQFLESRKRFHTAWVRSGSRRPHLVSAGEQHLAAYFGLPGSSGLNRLSAASTLSRQSLRLNSRIRRRDYDGLNLGM